MAETPTDSGRTRPGRAAVVAVLVAVGAVAGANARFVLGGALPGLLGTLAANVLGSLLLGALLSETAISRRVPRNVRVVAGTGAISSFTTYSTFVLDAVTATPAAAVGYVLASYVLGLAAVLAGRTVARHVSGGTT